MADFLQPLLADVLVNGMAVLVLCFVSYLCWLHLREKRRERRAQRDRELKRRNHWGYE